MDLFRIIRLLLRWAGSCILHDLFHRRFSWTQPFLWTVPTLLAMQTSAVRMNERLKNLSDSHVISI